MKVKELILTLVEMPQNAEVVCHCSSACSYLAPYSIDLVQEIGKEQLRGIPANWRDSRNCSHAEEEVVFVGSQLDKDGIEDRHFDFIEFFKPGHERNLSNFKLNRKQNK